MTVPPLVECRGAGRSYPGPVVALHPTSCAVPASARIAMVGPSGSGKSTLLYLLAGLEGPSSGEVRWPAIGDRRALRPGPVAMVFQGPSLLAPLTVRENVALPLQLGGTSRHEVETRTVDALAAVGVEALADALPEELSGGQAQRVAVARAIAGSPRLILADEPTGQLDHAAAANVMDALIAAADVTGAALVVATHDPAVADRLGACWRLHDGRILETQELTPA